MMMVVIMTNNDDRGYDDDDAQSLTNKRGKRLRPLTNERPFPTEISAPLKVLES